MIISQENSDRIIKEISHTLVDKIKEQGNVNWKNQFRHIHKIINLLESSIPFWSQYELSSYKQQILQQILPSKSDNDDSIDYSAFDNTEQVVSIIFGRISAIASFLSTHNDRMIDSKDAKEIQGFTHIRDNHNGTHTFDYVREIASAYKALMLTEIVYHKNLAKEEMC